jgi:hypothetical protein
MIVCFLATDERLYPTWRINHAYTKAVAGSLFAKPRDGDLPATAMNPIIVTA